MKNIIQLLEDLHAMFPLSEPFKRDITPMMREKRYKSKPLQYIDKAATKAWQLLEGTLIAMTYNETGKLVVVKIYKQRQIVCDLSSFFGDKPTTLHILAVGKVKVLELRKEDFLKLEKYAETHKLAQHIMMQEEQTEARRANMIALTAEDRVSVFAKNYAINSLPNLYCAMFLGLDVEEFTTLKAQLNLENEARHILKFCWQKRKIL